MALKSVLLVQIGPEKVQRAPNHLLSILRIFWGSEISVGNRQSFEKLPKNEISQQNAVGSTNDDIYENRPKMGLFVSKHLI